MSEKYVVDFADLAKLLDEFIDEELDKRKNREEKKKTPPPIKDVVDKVQKSIYISHPFSNNKKENIQKSEKLATELIKQFPDIAFFNPLSAFKYLGDAKLSYDDCLKHCLYWLKKCDGVLMAPGWVKSNGCNIERQEAIKNWIPVWNDLSTFAQAMQKKYEDQISYSDEIKFPFW